MTDLEKIKKIKSLINYAADMYETTAGDINIIDAKSEDDFIELKYYLMDLYKQCN